jgi:hypothetical protein
MCNIILFFMCELKKSLMNRKCAISRLKSQICILVLELSIMELGVETSSISKFWGCFHIGIQLEGCLKLKVTELVQFETKC